MSAVPEVPASTYRLQISKDFTLEDATEILDYIRDLGISWVYLSPLLKAEPGSTHGYDVIDHSLIDPERGGAKAFERFSVAAHERGLGVLVDIVPNHMGVATPELNAWWWQLLKEGSESDRAQSFDVDWVAGQGKVRIPVVGDDDLVGGRIAHLDVRENKLYYYDTAYPIAEGTQGEDANAVLERQHYALVNWREADSRLNYRRFFAVNTLAAIRVENRRVFDESHKEIRRWFAEGLADGVRVDHPDGLRDPAQYLVDLNEVTGGAYTLVEKILEPGEALEGEWATDGTTGYDALALIDRVLTAPQAERTLEDLEARLRGEPEDWAELVHHTKRAVADGILNSEVRRIARELTSDVEADTPLLEDTVAEILTCFPVYRSYLPHGLGYLQDAVERAQSHRPDLSEAIVAVAAILSDPEHPAALRFQQTSGMVMAKGVEDCAFYRYARLVSLNEVGGDPSDFCVSVQTFHAWAAERNEEWPDAMTALSTHDTKRGEDTRARIATLAEVPREWEQALQSLLEAAPLKDTSFAVLLWQSIFGAWDSADPDLRSRLHAYAEKAMREAGSETEWTAPNEVYESSVHQAVDAAFDNPAVHATVQALLELTAGAAQANSLSQKTLSLMIPGVPDVYQGSEILERSLVDPDNRRPVNFAAAAESLRQGASEKQKLTRAVLHLRRDEPQKFGSYVPLRVEGEAEEHALAFDRGGAVAVVTRLPHALAARGGFGETTVQLPEGVWIDIVTGNRAEGSVLLIDLLADSAAVVLSRAEESVR